MSNTSYIQNFFTSRDNNANTEAYVGQTDRLWYNPDTNTIRISDGVTPGGLPIDLDIDANLTVNTFTANSGNIIGNLVVGGNISPATTTKIGGVKAGPGANISNDGTLTIDTAGLPLSFGDFTANNNILTLVNVDQDMILATKGAAEVQLVGNIGFYKTDGFPPNTANRYFQATDDGQITILVPAEDPFAGGVEIIGSSTGNFITPGQPGAMLHLTGNPGVPTRIYIDGNDEYPSLVARRFNGNVSVPTQVLANEDVFRINATAATDAGVGNVSMAQIRITALENQTTTAQGSEITFTVTPVGQTALNRVEVANITVENGVTATKFTTAGTISATGNVTAGNLVIPTGNIIYTPRYGSFYSNVTQTNPIANTARAMTFNNTVTANGVSVVSNSQLTIAKTGVYNIQFSAQVTKSDGGIDYIEIWLDKNGTTIPWTNTRVRLTEAGDINIASWNFVETANSGDYFRLMWGSADTNSSLVAIPAASTTMNVDVPSVIVSVTPVGA